MSDPIQPFEQVFLDVGGEILGRQALEDWRQYKEQLLAGLREAATESRETVDQNAQLSEESVGLSEESAFSDHSELERMLEAMHVANDTTSAAGSHDTLLSLLNAPTEPYAQSDSSRRYTLL